MANDLNQFKTDIEEVIKWERKLKHLESFVANQIIKNIYDDAKIENYIKAHLIIFMKKYSVRTVFEACLCLNSKLFDLKKVEYKCEEIIKKNKERFKH